MAYIAMYLLQNDVEQLNELLNAEEEIAFIVSNGPKSWIARKEHHIAADIGTQKWGKRGQENVLLPGFAEYYLWHVPSGPLPLIQDGITGETIADPWQGWTELRTGANARMPFFGAGHPGAIHLTIKLAVNGEIGLSSFGWIGNHYKIIGKGALESTEKFWSKLKRTVKKSATQIPRADNPALKKEVFAFAQAYNQIQSGMPCALNP